MALAERHCLKVIEDCAQAHGAREKAARSARSAMSAQWSFLPRTRYITTGGEGGMVTTDDEALCRGCGRSRTTARVQAVYQRQHPPGFRWLHESFGTKLAADRDAGPRSGAFSSRKWRSVGGTRAQRHDNSRCAGTFGGTDGPVRTPALTNDARDSNGSRHASTNSTPYVRREPGAGLDARPHRQ